MSAQPLVRAESLRKSFRGPSRGLGKGRAELRAVDGVSLRVMPGETLGLVGESGCGKSTLGRLLLRLYKPTSGTVYFGGQDITGLSPTALRPIRREMQIIFQDPYSSLNPRMTVEAAIAEPLRVHRLVSSKAETRQRVASLLERVGLRPEHMRRYPHEFSGGQRQRIGIARALAVSPSFIVADEPVSALDVSIQAQIINLINELKNKLNISLIFISHDLSVVRLVSERVMVLYLGRVMELADRHSLYRDARHPYTQSLIAAIPPPDPDKSSGFLSRALTAGDLPSPLNPPTGCVFNTRCAHAQDVCREAVPVLEAAGPGHQVACHLWRRVKAPI